MKFTLAIISYNAEHTIKKCLDSCLNQTYKDLDIIVVDDNSTDATIEIVNQYVGKDKRVRIIKHEKNKSALQARKTAVKHATSQYIWFIDSDDHIVRTAVGEIFRSLKANNFPDMLTFGSNDYFENGELKRVFYDWGENKELKEWKFDSDYRPYTRVVKKEVLERAVNIIPDDLYLYRHNDFFMFNLVKMLTSTKSTLKRPLYNYTLSSSSVTNQKDIGSIERHINLIGDLLDKYKGVASTAMQDDVDVIAFVNKEKEKLTKYAIQQYKDEPKNYLYTLKKLNNYSDNIIISLTTYSKRIKTVHKTVLSLLNQTLLADKIILWLDETEIRHHQLPAELLDLESDVFEIRFCPNYKSYKKLIPTLQLYPDATVITFDDDIDYPADQVEKLVISHFKNPKEVITSVARNIIIKNNKLQPYSEWRHVFRQQVDKALYQLLPIGVGGVLYPKGALHPEVTNVDAFMSLAPHGDDLWFKCMTLMNDRKVIAINDGYNLSPYMVEGTQDVGLWKTVNSDSDSNFIQLTAVMDAYSKVKDKMLDPTFYQSVLNNDEFVELLHQLKELKVTEGKLKREIQSLKNYKNNTVSSSLVKSDNIDFDEDWYLKTYPDVAKLGIPAFEHYIRFGRMLNRKPNKYAKNEREVNFTRDKQ
ncbi:glycosyltransferase family 2 protein [Vibrio metschnikovii]|uniref:glycosyltransferase family 2 protein n=1 Tax=Vibrio metschnikovii TaxID=28172 RepID=UPI001C2FB7EC|nr:glycosyltransferase family A protein [Vibrio metschnikovii]